MEVTFKINIETAEDEKKAQKLLNAEAAHLALWDISQEIFRPARKHGYPDLDLQKLMESFEKSDELVSKLEEMFYDILKEYNLEIG